MKTKKKHKAATKQKCEANTEFCSGEILVRYGVNGSEKEGKTFVICGACMVILKRRGAKFKRMD